MKLLFDQNFAPRLVTRLSELFPGSIHVQDVGLGSASDAQIWTYASENGFTLISKDADFSDRVEVLGFPPKIIWLRKENCPTTAIELMLKKNFLDIKRFEQDLDKGILILF